MTDNDRALEFFEKHTKLVDIDPDIAPYCVECKEDWPCENFFVRQVVARYMTMHPFSPETGELLPVCRSCNEPITNEAFVRGPRGITHSGYCEV